MEYISQSSIHCSKGLFEYVINCTNFPEKKALDICSRQTIHLLDRDAKKLVLVLTNKRGRKFSHPQSSTTNSYPRQNHQNLALNIVFFQSNLLN